MKVCFIVSEWDHLSDCTADTFLTLSLARFLTNNSFDVTFLFAGFPMSGAGREARRLKKEYGIKLEFPGIEEYPSGSSFHPYFLRRSWWVYQWLKKRDFDFIFFDDSSSDGLIPIQAKATGEAFASTRLCFCLNGPSAWMNQLLEGFQLAQLDPHLDYAVQYATENADELIVPSAYFLQRIAKSEWQIHGRPHVLPSLPSRPATSTAPFSGTSLLVRYVAHRADHYHYPTFLQALFILDQDHHPAGRHLQVEFEILGNHRERRLLRKKLRRYFREYLPHVKWSVVPSSSQSIQPDLYLFSPVFACSPLPLLTAQAQTHPFLCARDEDLRTIISEDDSLVDWTPHGLSQALLRAIENQSTARTTKKVPDSASTKAQDAWSNFLASASKPSSSSSTDLALNGPLVSVCLSHYNKENYLSETLASLAKQTYSRFEVIVIDDASNERSLKVFNAEAEKYRDRGWKFLHRSRTEGPGKARNDAARVSTGKYLLFFDADDIAFPEMIQRMLQAALQPGVDCVGASSRRFRQNSNGHYEQMETSTYAGGCLETAFLYPPAGSVCLLSKSLFDKIGGFKEEFPEECHEDWNFHLKLLSRGFRLHILPEPVFGYRYTANNRASLVKRNLMHNFEPLLDAPPSIQRKLLLFSQNRAQVATDRKSVV